MRCICGGWHRATPGEPFAPGATAASTDPAVMPTTLNMRQARILDDYLSGTLADLTRISADDRVEARYQKFRRMGRFGQAKFF